MTQLIPLSYLNEACFLSLNVDEKKYSMVLKMAQEDLKSLLSKPFYDEIVEQYRANPQTLTSDNNTLYENYIKDYLAWQTYFYYLKFANVDVTPTGVREFIEENSSIASDVKMYSLEKNVRERAVYYKNEIINHLNFEQSQDSTKFPLWVNRCTEQMSFAITAISKTSDAIIRVNKAVTTNE